VEETVKRMWEWKVYIRREEWVSVVSGLVWINDNGVYGWEVMENVPTILMGGLLGWYYTHNYFALTPPPPKISWHLNSGICVMIGLISP